MAFSFLSSPRRSLSRAPDQMKEVVPLGKREVAIFFKDADPTLLPLASFPYPLVLSTTVFLFPYLSCPLTGPLLEIESSPPPQLTPKPLSSSQQSRPRSHARRAPLFLNHVVRGARFSKIDELACSSRPSVSALSFSFLSPLPVLPLSSRWRERRSSPRTFQVFCPLPHGPPFFFPSVSDRASRTSRNAGLSRISLLHPLPPARAGSKVCFLCVSEPSTD